MIRHYKSMFQYISTISCIWMIWFFKHYVSTMKFYSTPPSRVIISSIKNKKTFSRAKWSFVFLNSRWPFIKYFFALFTIAFNSFPIRSAITQLRTKFPIFKNRRVCSEWFFTEFTYFRYLFVHDYYHNILNGVVNSFL